ncbi:MAG: hypothetical protein HKO87_01110, partial [Acidimicrobiia bacterium]|nr:hypothetical protein [Acidimicrobiia bacterium]
METLDLLLAELSEVHRKLLELPDDAFAERHELLLTRDVLRDEMSRHHLDF